MLHFICVSSDTLKVKHLELKVLKSLHADHIKYVISIRYLDDTKNTKIAYELQNS